MLLLFSVGEDRFGLDVHHVVEVIPFINLKRLPKTPDYIAGLFNYRNVAVPVIDVSKMIGGTHVRRYLSTRIIIVHYPMDDGERHVLGLLAEHVTETVKFDKTANKTTRRNTQRAKNKGEHTKDEKGMVQCIRMDKLLPTDVRDALFKPIGDAGAAARAARRRCAPSQDICTH